MLLSFPIYFPYIFTGFIGQGVRLLRKKLFIGGRGVVIN